MFPKLDLEGWILCVYIPLNFAIIGSGNGLLPVQYKTITWTQVWTEFMCQQSNTEASDSEPVQFGQV